MDEVYLRALLEHATSEEPSMGQLVENSLHAGKRLARRRRIEAAIAAAVGIALIGFAVPAALGALGHNPSHHPGPATLPAMAAGNRLCLDHHPSGRIRGIARLTVIRLRDRQDACASQAQRGARSTSCRTGWPDPLRVHRQGRRCPVLPDPISTATDKAGRAIKLSIGVPMTAVFEVAPEGGVADGFLESGTKSRFVSMNLRTGSWRR